MEKVFVLEEETMRRLRDLQAALHGGTDKERDAGHKLWLFLNYAIPANYDEASQKLTFE